MKRRPWLVVGGAVVLLAGGGLWMTSRAESATVAAGELREKVVARAVVIPLAGTAEVRPRIDGQVMRVHVREGMRVKAGDLLAEIEPAVVKEEVERREAELRSLSSTASAIASGARRQEVEALEAELRGAKEELSLAKKRAAREEKLQASGASTASQLDEAKSAVRIAEARVESLGARISLAKAGGRPSEVRAAKARSAAAAAAVKQAEQELDKTKIVAPIPGVVLARRVDPGDTLTGTAAGTQPAAFEIADTSRVELRLEIEEVDAMRVTPGLAVTLRMPGQPEVIGQSTVDRVGAQLEHRTIGAFDARERGEGWVRTAWVKWDERRELPIGQRLEATIALPARSVEARIPRGAIQVTDGYAVVDVRSTFGWSSRRVELGAADDEFVEVRGVSPGTRVRVVH
ncbi:MAG: efflux RND transporter periplasmic adaptor subunit [Myxococcales bacterium]|nr:efflux RND transporter periplasmic adaptor subunit [Myxococcales bacterium]MCB9579973.1 efflux RND transporter periplasmic adaptor subunit [Polyangiaceae bacterium]